MADADIDLLNGLRGLYLEQLKTRLASMREVLFDIRAGRADAARYKALQSEAHRLCGTGATYGFPAISTAAERLEAYLIAQAPNSSEVVKLLDPLVEAMVEALEKKEVAPAPATLGARPGINIRMGSAAQKPTILVADDDPDILELVRRSLSPWAKVQCVETGYDAMSALERRRFDLVVLDYEFSDISGLEVLIQVNRMRPEARSPVIMMSATRERQKVIRLLAAGAQSYLVKPILPNLLLERVEMLLSRQRKIVLVVDDDPLIREIFRKRFVQRGHEVALASNGAEALEVARRIHPQAILLDRQMPRMDGNEFLKELRRQEETRGIPVIILSALAKSDDMYSGYQNGANAYISKPFVPDQVINCCENFLNTAKWNFSAPDGASAAVAANA